MDNDKMMEVGLVIEDTGEVVQMLLPSEDSKTATSDSVLMRRVNLDKNVSNSESSRENNKSQDYADDDNEKSSLFIWTTQSTELLLSLYEKSIEKFNTGEQRHQKIWAGIASKMNGFGYKVSWAQCQSKLSGMKKIYKKYLDSRSSSNDRKNCWPYFKRVHAIFGSCEWAKSLESEAGPSSCDTRTVNVPENVPKSRKDLLSLNNLWNEMKEERKKTRECKQKRHAEKMKKIAELIAERQKLHAEKMEMIQLLIENRK